MLVLLLFLDPMVKSSEKPVTFDSEFEFDPFMWIELLELLELIELLTDSFEVKEPAKEVKFFMVGGDEREGKKCKSSNSEANSSAFEEFVFAGGGGVIFLLFCIQK